MDHETTLSDLELEFTLVDPAVRLVDLSNYASNVRCTRRGEVVAHAFSVSHVVLECDPCGAETMVDLDESLICGSCGESLRPPRRDKYRKVYVASEEFRDGFGAVVQDTEFGLLTPEFAAAGRTHGRPVYPVERIFVGGDEGVSSVDANEPIRSVPDPSLEWEANDENPDWMWPKLDPKDLVPLTHTPTISAWQEPTWLFENGRPMTFLGYWDEARFEAEAPGGGEALFEQLVDDWAHEGWGSLGSNLSVYVFRGVSGKLRAATDMS